MWSNTCIPLFFFLFTLVLSILHFSTSDHTLINHTCTIVSRSAAPQVPYDFCTGSLLAAPGSLGATLEGLGLIALNLTGKSLTDTQRYMEELLKEKHHNKGERLGVKQCLGTYCGSNDFVQYAINSYKKRNFLDAAFQLDSVQDVALGCEYSISGFNISGMPALSVKIHANYRLATISVFIANLVQNGTYYDYYLPSPSPSPGTNAG